MSSARWRRFALERQELRRRSTSVEVEAECLVDLAGCASLPPHIRQNLRDTAARLKDEATYLRRAARELR